MYAPLLLASGSYYASAVTTSRSILRMNFTSLQLSLNSEHYYTFPVTQLRLIVHDNCYYFTTFNTSRIYSKTTVTPLWLLHTIRMLLRYDCNYYTTVSTRGVPIVSAFFGISICKSEAIFSDTTDTRPEKNYWIFNAHKAHQGLNNAAIILNSNWYYVLQSP